MNRRLSSTMTEPLAKQSLFIEIYACSNRLTTRCPHVCVLLHKAAASLTRVFRNMSWLKRQAPCLDRIAAALFDGHDCAL